MQYISPFQSKEIGQHPMGFKVGDVVMLDMPENVERIHYWENVDIGTAESFMKNISREVVNGMTFTIAGILENYTMGEPDGGYQVVLRLLTERVELVQGGTTPGKSEPGRLSLAYQKNDFINRTPREIAIFDELQIACLKLKADMSGKMDVASGSL